MKTAIVSLQVFLMLVILISPLLDPGYLTFSLMSLEPYQYLGIIFEIIGLVFVYLAKKEMARNFRVRIKPQENGNLVTTGVFGHTRNPMYFGGLLLCFGWGLSQNSQLGVISSFLLMLLLIVKIKFEEKELEKVFTTEFLQYKKRTPRLLPALSKANGT